MMQMEKQLQEVEEGLTFGLCMESEGFAEGWPRSYFYLRSVPPERRLYSPQLPIRQYLKLTINSLQGFEEATSDTS
jgi:hypothetical protein